MSPRYLIFPLLLLSLRPASLFGQQKYQVSVIDTEAGLPQGTIYSMFKDSRGFVWMGTGQSLSRYDGSQIRNYSTRPEPLGATVRNIVEDSTGNLWLSVGEVLTKFDRKKQTFAPVLLKTKTVLEPMKGEPLALMGFQIWCISPLTKELFCYDYIKKIKTVYLTQLPLFLDTYFYQYASTFDGNRYLWIHLTEGILRFDTKTHQKVYLFSKHPANAWGKPLTFTSFQLKKDGIYLRNKNTNTLVLDYALQSVRYVANPPPLEAATNDVVTVKNQNFEWFRDFKDGALWVKDGMLVYKLNPQLTKFNKVTTSTHPEFKQTVVRGVVELNDSIIRINTDSKKVHFFNRKTRQLLPIKKNDLFSQVAGRVFKDYAGHYWIMSSRGLFGYNSFKNKLTHHPHPDTTKTDDQSANLIQAIFEIDHHPYCFLPSQAFMCLTKIARITVVFPNLGL